MIGFFFAVRSNNFESEDLVNQTFFGFSCDFKGVFSGDNSKAASSECVCDDRISCVGSSNEVTCERPIRKRIYRET